jgi:hypothetical protein
VSLAPLCNGGSAYLHDFRTLAGAAPWGTLRFCERCGCLEIVWVRDPTGTQTGPVRVVAYHLPDTLAPCLPL